MPGIKTMGVMLYQVQYRSILRPTKARLNAWRKRLSEKEPLPAGVRAQMIRWVGQVSHEEALQKGEPQQAGIVKLYGTPFLSLLDIDNQRCPSLERVWRLGRLLQVPVDYIRIDRTRHGWHMVIAWGKRFRAVETVAIQACLGSDLKRETYNLARVMSGKRSKRWNLLFERKI